jgi:hypothetical protein
MKYLLAALATLATIQVASAQQGPTPTNYLDQLQCNFNPEGCQAWLEGKTQEATYRALWQNGATHEEALAGALNPQFLQALLPLLEARRLNGQKPKATGPYAPPQVTDLDQVQAHSNPAGYRAWRESNAREATYKGLVQLGATEADALAGATNPWYLQVLLPRLLEVDDGSPRSKAGGIE